MRRDRNRTIAAVVLLAALLAGCSQRQEPTTPAATLGALASEPPTAAPSDAPTDPPAPDPYAIPANPEDIDKAYVEKVLQELMVSISNAARTVARRGKLTEEAIAGLRATHRQDSPPTVVDGFRAALREDPSGGIFSRNAKPTRISVRKVISVNESCIFTLVLQNMSGLVEKKVKPFPGYYHLGLKRPSDDPDGRNPTPWVVVADAKPRRDGKEYSDPCT